MAVEAPQFEIQPAPSAWKIAVGEVLIDAGPAQSLTRRSYPTMELLIDPNDANLDLGTQLGEGTNPDLSSPTRFMGVSLRSHPTMENVLQAGAAGTGIAIVVTVATLQAPAAEAGGPFLFKDATWNSKAECDESVILVQKTPPPIAVAGGADAPIDTNSNQEAPSGAPQTFAPAESAAPIAVTGATGELPQDVEIALGNGVVLVNAAPCPPTEPKDIRKLITEKKHKKLDINSVADEVLAAYDGQNEARKAFYQTRGYSPEELVQNCLDAKGAAVMGVCGEVAWSILNTYHFLGDEKYYEIGDKWLDAYFTEIENRKLDVEKAEEFVLNGLEELGIIKPQNQG